MRCAILDDYQDVALGLADWGRLGESVEVVRFGDAFAGEDEAAAALQSFDIIVAMRERTPFPASMFTRLPRLRLLISTGMRNAAIDLEAAAKAAVTVCGTGGVAGGTVALTWALILGLARNLTAEALQPGPRALWQSHLGVDLQGKTLGLLGLGKIGSQVATIGQAFGMRVIAWSQNLDPARARGLGVEPASSKATVLAEGDIVSLHLVLSQRTRGIVGPAEFALMKPSAFFINTSRAGLADEAALIAALTDGRLAGAGLDVFSQEPLPQDHPLLKAPNLLATPHIGYVTRDNYEVFYREALEDVEAFLKGSPLRVLTAHM